MIGSGVFKDPVMGRIAAGAPAATGGFRSFTMFWLGGLAALSGAAAGQPIILRTATVPFLGGSLRRGGW